MKISGSSAYRGERLDIQEQSYPESTATKKHEMRGSPTSLKTFEYDIWHLKRQKQGIDPSRDRSVRGDEATTTWQSSGALSFTPNPSPTVDTTATLDRAAADWILDPCSILPLTMEYLDLYFAHVNQATYYMLPQRSFLKWVRECHEKTLDDKMVLYSLMALGCRFSSRRDSTAHGRKLLQGARQAEQGSFGRFTLQLVQTRLMLTLLNFSLGNYDEAWDYCGTATRAVCGLKYNTEDGIGERLHLQGCEYGLDSKTSSECRRRTFWSAYIMDVRNSAT
jgi:Fungal specific transcription factor domain